MSIAGNSVMGSVEIFRRFLEYDSWANREALRSLETARGSGDRPRQLLAHLLGAQRIWLARVEQQTAAAAEPWPSLSLDQCRSAVEELHERWTKVAQTLTKEKLAANVEYKTSTGAGLKTPLMDILMHVVMHSAYHRGQVAAAVRAVEGKPAVTDYVAYVRQAMKK